MQPTRTRSPALLISACSLFWVAGARAQTQPAPETPPTPATPASEKPAPGKPAAEKKPDSEEITVSAKRLYDNYLPQTAAATAARPQEQITPPATLTELVAGTAGVSENGQGGLFQVVSLRGISGHRVMTLVEGARITGERRAGVSASFIEPLLLEQADVIRGPASAANGSGALGGVVLLQPRAFTNYFAATGYETQGDENYQVVGYGNDGKNGHGGWSAGLARRRAGSAENPYDGEIHSGFTQYTGLIRKNWGDTKHRGELLVIPSYGKNIGKPNTDFPGRITTYPSERHLLTNLQQTWGPWRLGAFIHPNRLETLVVRSTGSRNRVENHAFDFGAKLSREMSLGSITRLRAGLDYFGRRNVDAVETSNRGAVLRTLNNGRENESALFASVTTNFTRVILEAGGRYTRQTQHNDGKQGISQTAGAGFAGITIPAGEKWRFSTSAGSGLRFPNLSERFFSGTTGAGGTVGNPDLQPERSFNVDATVHFSGEKCGFSSALFRNRIKRYIEQYEIQPDLFTYQNLTGGVIQGVEFESSYRPTGRWKFSLGGHKLQGRSDKDKPLADIPAGRVSAGIRYTPERWRFQAGYEYRGRDVHPGPDEKKIAAAQLYNFAAGYNFAGGLSVTMRAGNLADEPYFNSADKKTALAAGRSFGFGVSWQPD